MTMHEFVSSLAAIRFENCFNPYVDRCPIHDKADAPALRAALLSLMIRRAEERGVESLWIGRDLGYRGGRRTGLALTDDIHVLEHARRWGLPAALATKGPVVSERTASVIWQVLDRIPESVFLWNVFPLHPHEPDQGFTNRHHNARERRAGEEILADLVARLRPSRLVAIGGQAAASVSRVFSGQPVIAVRHPSYGGQREFLGQMGALYRGNQRRQAYLV